MMCVNISHYMVDIISGDVREHLSLCGRYHKW